MATLATNGTLRTLASELAEKLQAAYDPSPGIGLTGGQPLRDAFGAFGRDAALAGVPLEDTMAASVDSLQALFVRVGGASSDPTTILAAGISLAAASRAFLAAIADQPSAQPEYLVPSHLARLAALYRINRAATANLKLTEMLETTVQVVAETTGSDACAVFLFDEATDSLALCAAVGLNPASVGAVTIRSGQGITGRAAADGCSIAAPDAHAHEAFVNHHGIGDNVYTSQVSVPMLLRGPTRLVGVLNILTIARRLFDEDEMQFFQTVAGELAISIENARRYSWTDDSLRRKVTELGTLQRVSRIVASTLDLASVLRLITEQAVELIHAEAAAVFRLPLAPHPDAPSTAYVPIVEHRTGPVRELIDPAQRDRVVEEVLRSGTACAGDIAFVDGPSRLFCLPLNSARENLGALCFRLRVGTELSQDELGLLQAFSDSAALAIENAQLYQEARDGLETQSALVQEMHHRVRNNLQTVAALLSLQLRSAEDAPWAGEVRQAVNRIQAIASVHDLLSDERRLGGTTVDVIARHVAEDAHSTLIPPGLTVDFAIEPTDLVVPSKQATSLALLINELVSNAISHGFRDRSSGHIRMRAWRSEPFACIEVTNDGQRVPEGFVPAESRGLGMRIIQRLVTSDLRGEFTIRSTDEGTVAMIQFPLADHDPATS